MFFLNYFGAKFLLFVRCYTVRPAVALVLADCGPSPHHIVYNGVMSQIAN